MKYFLLFIALLLNQTCQKTSTTSPDAVVTAITDTEIQFSDGTKQAFITNEAATVFFLIRHAEKSEVGKDPDLTPEGQARAASLVDIFQEANLYKVYSTPYIRTINTALPTIKALNLEQGTYRTDKLGDFIDTLLEYQQGKRFLIVGHSNTTPEIVNHLAGNAVYENMDHEEYNTLFVVRSRAIGDSDILKLKF